MAVGAAVRPSNSSAEISCSSRSGATYPGETRTVDVHVHWLRAALEPDPGAPTIIQTVRGVGYVLRRPAAAAAQTPA